MITMPRLRLVSLLCCLILAGGCHPESEYDSSIPSAPVEDTPDEESTQVIETTKDTSAMGLTLEREPFGTLDDDREVSHFLLSNSQGMTVGITNFGATVTEVRVPDAEGNVENVTLSFPSLDGYKQNAPYFGGICGRYSNRIAGGRFELDGKEYQLATNNGPNHLHGGDQGFNKKLWVAETIEENDSVGVRLSYLSPAGEEGYPGELQVVVVYRLNEDNELSIDYTASATEATPLNLTNHCYWNLDGAGSGTILDHELQLNCSKYLPVDDTGIPTGELADVQGTPMDFTSPHKIGAEFENVEGGYDHCYVVDGGGTEEPVLAAIVTSSSGRRMEIETTEPGLQFYTGNFLDGSEATGGFEKNGALCLEAQHFPDSPNQPDFPNTILAPSHVYRQVTIHRFSAE